MKVVILLFFNIAFLYSGSIYSQALTVPAGAQTRWVIENPEEIVQYITFDPSTVESKLPEALRYITINELAIDNVGWAINYLDDYPSNGSWGVSFLEIVRMETFMIDDKLPDWPRHGAAALWCARIAPSDPSTSLGFGRPLLVMEFWMPDNAYVSYMKDKGHYASYGDVGLYQDQEKKWRGSIQAKNIKVIMSCNPSGQVFGGANSSGAQSLFPPLSSPVNHLVKVAFSGHREQECDSTSSWSFQGTHPLAKGILVGTSRYEYGYSLIGGAYPNRE
ncbi:MAG: hypothetical protein ABJJ25_10920 [Eudoraea sp.]|jgi:hypothetical protein|uniref:hypothetical protein n=1 Tax=Eudoraea sp. TaxID=1979955 RepID=UPI0032676168